MSRPTTPPSSHVMPYSSAPDTVPRARHTSSHPYRTGDLNLGRIAVLKDLEPIHKVPWTYFTQAVLPPLHANIDIQNILNALRRSGDIVDEQWKVYPGNKNHDKASEEDYYARLSKVFDAITEEAKNATQIERKVTFISKPNFTPFSERKNTSRPDAYLHLVQRESVAVAGAESRDSWDDIAVSFEFKRSGGAPDRETYDDERKVIWNMHHIMRSDPCRRFTFAVTIEAAQLRMWFTCRSVTLVSEPFDFITNPTKVIHLFCSLAFAEHRELGWDSTMKRIKAEQDVQYKITMDSGTTYITTSIIADYGAEAMVGRSTRVFKAYREDDPDKTPVVIKDSWRVSDREREDQILRNILSDVDRLPLPANDVEIARGYFLTVIEAEDVKTDQSVDTTLSILHGVNIPEDSEVHVIPAEPSISSIVHSSSKGHTPTYHLPVRFKPRGIHHRIHSRVVFKEVCQTLYDFQGVRDVHIILAQLLRGLYLLHKAGWVHRDISPGNTLVVDMTVKIADLEYAKRLGSDQTHDIRTGTIEFMSCEVALQSYLYFDLGRGGAEHGDVGDVMKIDFDSINDVFSTHRTSTEAVVNAADAAKQSSAIPADDPVFVYNPLHDIESVWWIWVWVIFFYTDDPHGKVSQEQQDAFQTLFPSIISKGERVLNKRLDLKALPHKFRNLGIWAEETRHQLVKGYISSEKTLPPNYQEHHKDLCDYFSSKVMVAMSCCQGIVDTFHKPICSGKESEKRKATTANNLEPSKRVKQS